jgi:ribosomal protein S9
MGKVLEKISLKRQNGHTDKEIGGEIMKIPIELYPNLQRLDRAAREKKHGKTDQMAAILEALAKSLSTLNPNLSDARHNRDLNRNIADFII